jgi:hypothetical protein
MSVSEIEAVATPIADSCNDGQLDAVTTPTLGSEDVIGASPDRKRHTTEQPEQELGKRRRKEDAEHGLSIDVDQNASESEEDKPITKKSGRSKKPKFRKLVYPVSRADLSALSFPNTSFDFMTPHQREAYQKLLILFQV